MSFFLRLVTNKFFSNLSSGVTIEAGAAGTVLMASKIGVPISTTHCKVGAVACVGWVYGKTFDQQTEKTEYVNWRLFGSIGC